MKKVFLSFVAVLALLLVGTAAFAQETGSTTALLAQAADDAVSVGKGYLLIGIGLGCGLVLVGVGLGIGRIGGSAVEAIARQPEAAGPIGTNMIIAAALIEGAGLFGLVICMLGFFLGGR